MRITPTLLTTINIDWEVEEIDWGWTNYPTTKIYKGHFDITTDHSTISISFYSKYSLSEVYELCKAHATITFNEVEIKFDTLLNKVYINSIDSPETIKYTIHNLDEFCEKFIKCLSDNINENLIK